MYICSLHLEPPCHCQVQVDIWQILAWILLPLNTQPWTTVKDQLL